MRRLRFVLPFLPPCPDVSSESVSSSGSGFTLDGAFAAATLTADDLTALAGTGCAVGVVVGSALGAATTVLLLSSRGADRLNLQHKRGNASDSERDGAVRTCR